ncbi:Crp/Fnr family transcriptional regulator [Devosia aurantiaca]|uniref:Crp/Fnr family transcriptional regulator n=1 Tax=Devosia aurantiaca TaxID=2714858 RepID=A0A6M1T0P3_9HYPH|nr:Crp/Fnr family transcriptional regulator [Devosia aurantiaca]NGP18461.1 Crp/Fnr family transcriptional regulator [Devosia aurantiaca]
MASITSATQPLAAKLREYEALSREEEQVLESAVSAIRDIDINQDMVVEGESPDHSTLLLSGYAARYNMTADGRRQITAVHISGDFVDLHSFLMRPMDHSIVALTPCRIAVVPHTALTRITETQPHLTRILWLSTVIDGGIHRKWAVALGSLQGHQQLAHLICELYLRLKQVDLTDGWTFQLPLTQTLLSEALALSTVHTNRVVQVLRKENVIRWERDQITILDWDRLVEIAEFDPIYLRAPRLLQEGQSAA